MHILKQSGDCVPKDSVVRRILPEGNSFYVRSWLEMRKVCVIPPGCQQIQSSTDGWQSGSEIERLQWPVWKTWRPTPGNCSISLASMADPLWELAHQPAMIAHFASCKSPQERTVKWELRRNVDETHVNMGQCDDQKLWRCAFFIEFLLNKAV